MGENNLKKRIRNAQCREKIMSAEEAASFIRPGMTIGSSGFTPAGYPKMIPAALAKRAEAGEKLDLTLLTGASTGDEMDGVLARAGVIRRRIPYQTNKDLRDAINRGEISYMDMHLSQKIVVLKDFPLLEFKILQGILMMWVFIMENTLK